MTTVGEGYAFKFIIDFNPNFKKPYESIVTEKLLTGISNVAIAKGSNVPRLCIPHDAYNQFIQNVERALKELNKSIVALT